MNRLAKLLAVSAVAVAILTSPVLALEAMDDGEMGAVTGQQGIQLSLEYYYNSVRTESLATTGAGLASCTDGGLADRDCRLAWQLANRGGAAASGVYAATTWTLPGGGGCDGAATCKGEWLVWKGGWASLAVNNLNLDAAFLGDAISSGASYESWLDGNNVAVYGSFRDSAGNCLMTADPSGAYAPCTVDYIKNMPALRTHFDNGPSSYSNATKSSSGFSDARFGLVVSGLSAEYDTGGTPGWDLNNFDSFTSLKIADNNSNQAGIAFGGDFYLYGF